MHDPFFYIFSSVAFLQAVVLRSKLSSLLKLFLSEQFFLHFRNVRMLALDTLLL
jgi:hypothetical protein